MKMVTQIFATGISLKVLQRGTLCGHSLYFFCKGHSLWSCVTATDVERPGGADYVLSVALPMEIVTQNLWHSRSV